MSNRAELRAMTEGIAESLEIAVRNLDAFAATKTNKRVTKVLVAAALAKSARELGNDAYGRYKNARMWSIRIEESNPLFDYVLNWAAGQDSPVKRKSVSASVARRGERAGELSIRYDTEGSNELIKTTLGGHKIEIYLSRKDNVPGAANPGDVLGTYTASAKPSETLIIRSYSREGRDAALELLESLTQKSTYEPGVFMPSSWGEWRRKDDAPVRDFTTVILKDGLRDDLIADLKQFYDVEDEYTRIGAPWHRGYLFHGPPGTGKTSIAKALATEFNLDLHYLPIVDVKDEESLSSLMSSLKPRSILLIEDIDVAHASRVREDDSEGDHKGVTMSGLLNALDGVVTPHGLVTIMTTNKLEALDPALVRPGRADRVVEIGYPDDEQLERLIETFVQNPADRVKVKARPDLSMADVVEVIKQHLYDKTGLRAGLEALNAV